MVRKLRRRCGFCDNVFTVGEEIFWEADPFVLEIHDEVWMSWICERCYDSRKDDI